MAWMNPQDSARLRELVLELKKQDPAIWEQWHEMQLLLDRVGREEGSIASTCVLLEVLRKAIDQKNWTWYIAVGINNSWYVRLKTDVGVYTGESSSMFAEAALLAYLRALPSPRDLTQS